MTNNYIRVSYPRTSALESPLVEVDTIFFDDRSPDEVARVYRDAVKLAAGVPEGRIAVYKNPPGGRYGRMRLIGDLTDFSDLPVLAGSVS